MTDPVTTWVGCLVLVVAAEPLSATAAEAVRQVEQLIYNDPVYLDASRVATPADDPLSGDLDTVAFRLYRDLVYWGASPARNPAPLATFCVLLVHPDPQESDRLVNALANTPRLGELPIIFRTANLAAPDSDGHEADLSAELVPHIMDAIEATAHEVDRTAGFSLPAEQLARMAASTSVVPAPQPAFEEQPVEPPPEAPVVPAQAPEDLIPAVSPASDLPVPTPARSPESAGRIKLSLTGLVPDSVLDRSRELLARRKLPSSGVDVIEELSEHVNRVVLLYLVFASEPVKLPRAKRRARAEFACTLTHSLLAPADGTDRDPWFVRTFSAGRKLNPGRPLSDPALLRYRDFPDQWGEHFDLFDASRDILDTMERDRSSFRRRDVEPVRTAVVFIAGSLPHIGEDIRTRLSALCSAATVTWVSFERGSTEEDEERFESAGAQVFEHHEDLVDELRRVVEPPIRPDGDEELTAVSAEPSSQSEE